EEADAAASVLAETIAERTGVRLDIAADAERAGDIVLRHSEAGGERYSLRVGELAHIEGSSAGLFYGVQTLRQLLSADGDGGALPHVEIDDAPRYEYRGVMLD